MADVVLALRSILINSAAVSNLRLFIQSLVFFFENGVLVFGNLWETFRNGWEIVWG